MNDIIEEILNRTGIFFDKNDLGIADYRYNCQFSDRDLNKGEGYSLTIKIGEVRGTISLQFDTFGKLLLAESKKLLKKNKNLIFNNNFNGKLEVMMDGIPLVEDISDFSNIDEISFLYESSMYDLRKDTKFQLLKSDLGQVASFITLSFLPYEIEKLGEIEGEQSIITSSKYERSRRNRSICIAFHGVSCKVCAFNFENSYGIIAQDYIHVHHIVPISVSGKKQIDPVSDLIPLCPNCHAVAHLKDPPYSPDDLRMFLRNRNESI